MNVYEALMRDGRKKRGEGEFARTARRDVLSVVAEWALAGHITERGVTCEAGDAIRAAVASELGPPLRVPACPFAVLDEFGEGADDRVQDYAARLVAGAEHERADATKRALFQAQEAAKDLARRLDDERERCAQIALNGCLVPPDGGSPTEAERMLCEEIARRIRGA